MLKRWSLPRLEELNFNPRLKQVYSEPLIENLIQNLKSYKTKLETLIFNFYQDSETENFQLNLTLRASGSDSGDGDGGSGDADIARDPPPAPPDFQKPRRNEDPSSDGSSLRQKPLAHLEGPRWKSARRRSLSSDGSSRRQTPLHRLEGPRRKSARRPRAPSWVQRSSSEPNAVGKTLKDGWKRENLFISVLFSPSNSFNFVFFALLLIGDMMVC